MVLHQALVHLVTSLRTKGLLRLRHVAYGELALLQTCKTRTRRVHLVWQLQSLGKTSFLNYDKS